MSVTRRDLDLWPESFRGGLFDWPVRPFETWRRLIGEDDMNVEEFVEDDKVVVRVEVPGIDPDRDVDVSIVDGDLRIKAERRQEEETQRRNYRRSEIRYGVFSRTLPMPAGVKEDDVKATYRDGILEVRAPMEKASAKPSKIPIAKK